MRLHKGYTLLISAIILAIQSLSTKSSSTSKFDHLFRLPNHFQPLVYDLRMTLGSLSDRVYGQVQIQMQCKNATNEIRLHSNAFYITIDHATLENRLLGENISLDFPFTNWTTRTISFMLEEELIENHVYYLNIWYRTQYSEQKHGLLRQKDTNKNLWINTLFEPSFARQMMPCFDEPSYRSGFKLELWLQDEFADGSYVALSAMPGARKDWSSNLTIWTFPVTPPIPTYLFSFAVGKFRSYCDFRDEIDAEICIWRSSHLKKWEKTAGMLMNAIATYQKGMLEYLLIEPNAKLYILNAPIKLKGMENFGLLNIRQNLWPHETDLQSFEAFSRTMYHEMAHQWFGNLVTVDWWSDIWLSEGLTTFLSSYRPVVFNPISDTSIEPLVSPKWAKGIPPIAYSKGAAVLEMLDSVLGARKMRRLLREYLRRHQYGSASTEDFLNIVGEVAPNNSAPYNFLHSWLHLGSYPIVFIDFDRATNEFHISQSGRMPACKQNRWWIPVWVECLAGTVKERLMWLKPAEELHFHLSDVTLMNSSDAVAFSRNYAVYYQISYRY